MISLSERQWRIAGLCVAGLFVFGAVLFGIDRCSSFRFASKQDKLKANVNTTIQQIENRNAVMANLKEQQAADIERVRIENEEYQEAQKLTDAAKAETNKAIENMKNAARTNGNVSVEEFKEKIRGL